MKKHLTTKVSVLIFICIIVCSLCASPFILAKITGQFCLDFMSGQVPETAEKRYFELLFTAVTKNDFKTVTQLVDSEHAVDDLQTLKPIISTSYEVIWGDDLAGTYERLFRFDNGTQVYLNYEGFWRQCPDFDVTDEEIRKSVKLIFIELDKN
jgi:hypothetical protein